MFSLVRHREDEVVELREFLARQHVRVLHELRELLEEVVLGGGDGELLACGRLERGGEDVHHLAEAVLDGVRDLLGAGGVDQPGVLDDLGEDDDVFVARERLAHRLARAAGRDVAHHRVVGEHEVRDEVLDCVQPADVVQRLGGLRVYRLGHGLDDIVDVADDRRLDDELAVADERLLERDVRHVLEHRLHLLGERCVVAHELLVVGVQQRLRVAHVLACEGALGHLHEDARVVVAVDERV